MLSGSESAIWIGVLIPNALLTRFVITRPAYEIEQAASLAWLAAAHTEAEAAHAGAGFDRDAFATKIGHAIERVACGPSNWGMHMTLARDVPERVAGAACGFVVELYRRAGLDIAAIPDSIFAVHPGGPRIIDRVRDVLELSDAQVQASRDVLRAYSNMSSATLPHIWHRLLGDPAVPRGTLIPSLAFGPGLTMCGALLEKR